MKKIVLDKDSNFVFCFADSNVIVEKRGERKEEFTYKNISNVEVVKGESQVFLTLLASVFLAFTAATGFPKKMFRRKSILKIDLHLGNSIVYRIDKNINIDTIQEVIDCFQSKRYSMKFKKNL